MAHLRQQYLRLHTVTGALMSQQDEHFWPTTSLIQAFQEYTNYRLVEVELCCCQEEFDKE